MKKNVLSILPSALILWSLGICVQLQGQPVQVTGVSNNSRNFVTIGDLVFFSASDSLWRTDGTASGTMFLAKGSFSRFTGIKFNDRYYLINSDKSELWVSDGTPSGTSLLKSSSPYTVWIHNAGQHVYFTASDAMSGLELFRTNGTEAGTDVVKDINPGPANGIVKGIAAAAVGDHLFFAATDGVHGVELWKTDGSAAGTVMVKDIYPGPHDGVAFNTAGDSFGNILSHAGKFYFIGLTPDEGRQPWVSDGSAEGTLMLTDMVPGTAGHVYYKLGVDETVYFITKPLFEQWYDYGAVADLWKTGGTVASTSKVATVGDATTTFDDPFKTHNGKVYFFARLDGGPHYLVVTDGTSDGTKTIFNAQTYEGDHFMSFFDVVNDLMLFYGTADGSPSPFYRSDGTSAGTQEFTRFNSAAYLSGPRDPTKAGDFAFYADHDGPSDEGQPRSAQDYYHLIQTDGISTQSMRTLFGVNTVGTDNITDYNGKVLFTTRDDQFSSTDKRTKLWIYDPAARVEPTAYFTLVNAETDDDIVRLTDDYVFSNPSLIPINIRYDPVEVPGSVVFKINGVTTRTESAAPYSLAGDVNGDYAPWKGAKPGTYELTAIPYSEPGGNGIAGEALTITFTIKCQYGSTDCIYTGEILREYWDGVAGNKVSDIPLGTEPDSRRTFPSFEGPTNAGTNYGARYRGFVVPSVTGQYTFWIASNDHSELWLSTDDQVGNKVRIAWVTGATDPRQWNKFASQKSSPVMLTAGRKYYIEALHKQGVGTDHVAVGWQLPDGALERPIPGNRLSPFIPGTAASPTVKITSPADGQTFTAPADILIQADAHDGDDGTITRVRFYANSTEGFVLLGEDREAPYAFAWNDVAAGSYSIYVHATDAENNTVSPSPVHITVDPGSGPCASGTISRDYWAGVQGNRVSDIPVEREPTSTGEISSFQGPSNIGTNYGSRIRGYICPPLTGSYQFWISSNDHSELWLSTSDNPANKQLIAWVTGATDPLQWNKYTSQRSVVIALTAGTRYYIEALHKQGIGTDHVAVAWMMPDQVVEAPIPGNRLSPYDAAVDASARIAGAAGESEEAMYSQINIYPNPAMATDTELTISGYEGLKETIETQVEIINMTGDVVFMERIHCGGDCGSYLMKIDEQLVPGVYLVNLKSNGMRYSKRLLVK